MNTQTLLDWLNETDLTILQAIRDGNDDTFKIREATTLTNREINYSLDEKSLEERGLVQLHRVQGQERREVNGHTTTLPHAPKRVTLTEKGREVLQDVEEVEKYRDMSRMELIRMVREHEERIKDLETRFDVFRRQVKEEFQ